MQLADEPSQLPWGPRAAATTLHKKTAGFMACVADGGEMELSRSISIICIVTNKDSDASGRIGGMARSHPFKFGIHRYSSHPKKAVQLM